MKWDARKYSWIGSSFQIFICNIIFTNTNKAQGEVLVFWKKPFAISTVSLAISTWTKHMANMTLGPSKLGLINCPCVTRCNLNFTPFLTRLIPLKTVPWYEDHARFSLSVRTNMHVRDLDKTVLHAHQQVNIKSSDWSMHARILRGTFIVAYFCRAYNSACENDGTKHVAIRNLLFNSAEQESCR